VTFETKDNYLIRSEMKKHYSHSTTKKATKAVQIFIKNCMFTEKNILKKIPDGYFILTQHLSSAGSSQ